ncbi:MAG: hypothetical protein PHP82_04310 [Candidatus ainarchaeum sp.]|nr:hypothetical protein [Candidatus ainarchaeum sp.]
MHGNLEFLLLFIPFLLIGLTAFYAVLFVPLFFFIQIILILVGIICFSIDIFALLVQYVNWKYYKE